MSLISIITPVYNAEKFLEQTLQSIHSQTYKNFEALLILDKNSTDESSAIIDRWAAKDARFRVLRNLPQGGVSFNRNHGISLATGDFICFLDSDDLWESQKLTLQLKFMIENNLNFSCAGFNKISEDGLPLPIIITPPAKFDYTQLLKNNQIGCLTVMLSKKLAQTVQFQDVMHEDMVYWIQLLHKTQFAFGIPQVLASYRVVHGSRSSNKFIAAKARWHILRHIEKLTFFKSSFFFMHYAFSAIFKY